MPTNSVKQSNKQIVNVILSDLVRKRKRKSKPSSSATDERRSEPQPESLQAAAQRVRPALFYPTNVIYSNPPGATSSQQPVMFDVSKANQLNAYENLRSNLKRNISEVQTELDSLSQNGGNPEVLTALERQLDEYKQYLGVEPEDIYNDPSLFSDSSSSVYQFQEMPSERTGFNLYDNQMYDAPAEREMEGPKALPQADPVDDPADEPPPEKEAIMREPDQPEALVSREFVQDSIDKHGQKRVIEDGYRENFLRMLEKPYESMPKKEQTLHRRTLKNMAIEYVSQLLPKKEQRHRALAGIEDVFQKGKHWNTQQKYLQNLLGVNIAYMERPPA